MKSNILVKEVKQSFRNTKKGRKAVGRWDVSVHLPQIEGVVDSKIIGSLMAAEVIDQIRENWKRGRQVNGRPYHPENSDPKGNVRMRRFTHFMLTQYSGIISAASMRARDLKQAGLSPKQIRIARRLRKFYTLPSKPKVDVNGIKTKPKFRQLWVPKYIDYYMPLRNSDMMIETLHGKWRNRPRKYRFNGQDVAVSGSIMIRVPSARTVAAKYAGGLNSDAQRYIENYRLTNTRKLLNHTVWVRGIEKGVQTFNAGMRVLVFILRILAKATK